jgi:transposase
MSLSPEPLFNVPKRTTEVTHATFPRGNRYMMMRDEYGTIYRDDQFADLYPSVGQPAEMPRRLALVTILQFAENLTDRQTADDVWGRIDRKYAVGLELTDADFDFSILSEFRTRLIVGGAEE